MTHRAGYASLVDNIFGAGSTTFDVVDPQTNNVLGALASPNGFAQFNANFEERLRRLSVAIHADASLRKEVLGAVNRVAEDE